MTLAGVENSLPIFLLTNTQLPRRRSIVNHAAQRKRKHHKILTVVIAARMKKP